MKISSLVILALITISPISIFSQGIISLDHVDGLFSPSEIKVGDVKFHIRMTNNTGVAIDGQTNSFRVYSINGATWDPIVIKKNDNLNWDSMYDGGIYYNYSGVTGYGADSAGIGGFRFYTNGIPDGFDEIIATITTNIPASAVGTRICLDSCWMPPSWEWVWATHNNGRFYPAWDGPHCYKIIDPPPCCLGSRGDINYDGRDIDISDLSALVDFLFDEGGSIDCFEEADVNADARVGISDLTCVVDFIFGDGQDCVKSCY